LIPGIFEKFVWIGMLKLTSYSVHAEATNLSLTTGEFQKSLILERNPAAPYVPQIAVTKLCQVVTVVYNWLNVSKKENRANWVRGWG
jgi:hypothetical protein